MCCGVVYGVMFVWFEVCVCVCGLLCVVCYGMCDYQVHVYVCGVTVRCMDVVCMDLVLSVSYAVKLWRDVSCFREIKAIFHSVFKGIKLRSKMLTIIFLHPPVVQQLPNTKSV